MGPLPKPSAVHDYLGNTLGVAVAPMDIGDLTERLPAFLRQRYLVSALRLMGHACLVLTARGRAAPAEDVGKHLAIAGATWTGPVAYLAEEVPLGLRRRLIAARVPFIVPGRQTYLPFLALDIQERTTRQRTQRPLVRPATQAVLLWWIHHGMAAADTPKRLVPALGYTLMSLSRVFDELEDLQPTLTGLAIDRHGRERRARWTGTARELWEAVAPRLRDPVRGRLLVSRTTKVERLGLPSGLDGLARCSDLAPPDRPVLAVAHDAWLAHARQHQPRTTDAYDPAAVEIELWRYATDLHRQKPDDKPPTADPLSLVVALRQAGMDGDERVEQAIRHTLEGCAWRW